LKARAKCHAAGSEVASGHKAHLLVIEDEADLQELLHYNLMREGFLVTCADCGELGLEMARRNKPDLLILDLMLPGMDGLEVCRVLRAESETASISIMMLTAKDQETDIVLGLELGADDYVTKPYRWRELMARIKAVLRRRAARAKQDQADDCVIQHQAMVVDPQRHKVTVADCVVELTATEFKLLYALAGRPGRVFTRRQLIKRIHGELVAVTDRSIDVQIVSLRRKLNSAGDGQAGETIETVHGIGYRFKEEK